MFAPFLQKHAVKSPTLLRAVSWALSVNMIPAILISSIVFLLLAFSIPMWRTRTKIESLLVTNHRDFLKDLKIDGFHKLPFSARYGEGYQAKFSVQVGGKTKDYNSIFSNYELLSKLGNDEINTLCLSHKKHRKRFIITCIILVCGFALIAFLPTKNT